MLDHEFQTIIEDMGYRTTKYSGRGMYGEHCLGVDLDRNQSVFELIADLIKSDARNHPAAFAALIRALRIDDLGLGTIAYFPTAKFSGEEKAEDE
jgi:hypothetical protein